MGKVELGGAGGVSWCEYGAEAELTLGRDEMGGGKEGRGGGEME